MVKPYLSIIIPAFNEAERIPKTLIDIDHRLEGVSYTYEIIVVNDGSKDNTAEVVTAMMKMVKNLKLIDNEENKGKGGVTKQGMLAATGDIRLFTDADNSTSIDQFQKMAAYFNKNGSFGVQNHYDVVIGSRAVKGSILDPAEPWYRQIPGKVGNLVIQALLLPGLWDTQCGFKAFTEESAVKIFNASRINGWGFDIEALALAKRMGYLIKEVPVHWINDTRSKVKVSSYIAVLLETLTIRWRFWTNWYTIDN